MGLWRLILAWWHARQRKIDMDILWPICRREARGDLNRAKAAFAVHAYNDPAWLELGEDTLFQTIDGLT